MKPKVKVVIGTNYGDEGKGLVSGFLAKQAVDHGHRVLTVLFNGGVQRAHTANGKIHHCTGAGVEWGSDTYYAPRFMLDPIALWLEGNPVIVDPRCRVVLPHDVMAGRNAEIARGSHRHGSCGMGIFAACRRNVKPETRLLANELFFKPVMILHTMWSRFDTKYGQPNDLVYNRHNFFEAVKWMQRNCRLLELSEIADDYGTIIFEGGQGLLLDQGNRGGFPHLTPSSTGSRNVIGLINAIDPGYTDLYYVSRTYMTRHGAGKLQDECEKDQINPDIVDETNVPNEWQGSLRFGFMHPDSLIRRVKCDSKNFDPIGYRKTNLVFTQANYTDGKLAIGEGKLIDISPIDGIDSIWISDNKETMTEWIPSRAEQAGV